MQGNVINNVKTIEILGNVYNVKGSSDDHVNHRIKKCRQSFYALSPAGMVYPGASMVYPGAGMVYPGATTDVQSYLYKRICQPVLTYGLECINMSQCQIGKVNSIQGKLMKQSLGLGKNISQYRNITSFGY